VDNFIEISPDPWSDLGIVLFLFIKRGIGWYGLYGCFLREILVSMPPIDHILYVVATLNLTHKKVLFFLITAIFLISSLSQKNIEKCLYLKKFFTNGNFSIVFS